MGNTIKGPRLVKDDDAEKTYGHSSYLVSKTSLPSQDKLNKQIRVEIMSGLLNEFPELLKEKDIMELKTIKQNKKRCLLLAIPLYSISIFLGRFVISGGKHRNIKFGLAYLFPLVILVPYIIWNVPLAHKIIIANIAKRNEEEIPNHILYSYGLTLNRNKFL